MVNETIEYIPSEGDRYETVTLVMDFDNEIFVDAADEFENDATLGPIPPNKAREIGEWLIAAAKEAQP